ncbi:MAG: hypothetical protein IMF11_05665 [Proteobacteria bacterium]|nr:hypothetical protein [Pseudomonadota bacterium]
MGRKKGSGKKLECLECFHCKTMVFEKVPDLMAWCGRRSIKPNATWIEGIVSLGMVRLMWCEKQTSHAPYGFFPRNASPRHTADFEKILEKEKDSVFVSSQSKEPFISGAWDNCPFKDHEL